MAVDTGNQPRDRREFRPDIQGLRAVSVFAVLVGHAGFGWGSGGFVGIDIFFVISGFLITGLLVREVERSGSLSLTGFYARRIRRLLPLAVTVLVVTVIASWLFFSPLQADVVSGDVIAASLYFINWRFAAQEADYFAVDPLDSPLQHFWSLAVEEQFYLVWPLLMLVVVGLVARRGGTRLRPAVGMAMAAVAIPSLVYSLVIVDLESNGVYFSTLPRMWEFALGGGLALALPAALKLPRAVVGALAWGGVATIVYTVVVFSRDMEYPGAAALLPSLAAAALLVAGTASVRGTLPMRVLSSRPMQHFGDISYAWYLWHWPALVFAREEWGPLTTFECTVVIALSWIPTIVSHHLIENPVRYGALTRRPRYAFSFGVASIAAAVFMALGLVAVQPQIEAAEPDEVQGARAWYGPAEDREYQRRATRLSPTPQQAADDRGEVFDDGCLVPQDAGSGSPDCVYGRPNGRRTAVLFGDSHAMHYFPAIEPVALRRGWRLVVLTRADCVAPIVDYGERCNRWREATLRRIAREERPDLVLVGTITMSPKGISQDGEALSRQESEPLLEEGFRKTLERLRGTGARVVTLADTPRSLHDVAECVSEHRDELMECAWEDRRRPEGQYDVRAARSVRGVKIVELADLICPDGLCAPVIGDSLVFRDTAHLTATFAASANRWFARRLPHRP